MLKKYIYNFSIRSILQNGCKQFYPSAGMTFTKIIHISTIVLNDVITIFAFRLHIYVKCVHLKCLTTSNMWPLINDHDIVKLKNWINFNF